MMADRRVKISDSKLILVVNLNLNSNNQTSKVSIYELFNEIASPFFLTKCILTSKNGSKMINYN